MLVLDNDPHPVHDEFQARRPADLAVAPDCRPEPRDQLFVIDRFPRPFLPRQTSGALHTAPNAAGMKNFPEQILDAVGDPG